MFEYYIPTSRTHAILLAIFCYPMYKLYAVHTHITGMVTKNLLEDFLMACYLLIAMFGAVLFGVSFLWKLCGEFLFLALGMKTPMKYEIEAQNRSVSEHYDAT